jgi:hypothetical protein
MDGSNVLNPTTVGIDRFNLSAMERSGAGCERFRIYAETVHNDPHHDIHMNLRDGQHELTFPRTRNHQSRDEWAPAALSCHPSCAP